MTDFNALWDTYEHAVETTASKAQQFAEYGSRPNPSETTPLAWMAAETTWGAISGYLRGRVPYPVPVDLRSVAVSSAFRVHRSLESGGVLELHEGEAVRFVERADWVKFTMTDRMILNRYRQRTA